MGVAIVRYNAGNIRSVVNAVERLGESYIITDEPSDILQADRVIFPGVGEARSAMEYLRERRLDQTLRSVQAPLLGICLGMQLLSDVSEEGETRCLGLIRGQVKRFTKPRKIPHMGWSRVEGMRHPLFQGIHEGSYFYFVHSYRLDVVDETIATCRYEESFSAAAAYRNFAGVQFHPEKSAESGERFIRNFLEWRV